jgi:hypothetical protein
MKFKKVLSYLKLEGHGRGIIMEVTCPLLLGPFYLVKWPVNPNILAASVLDGLCLAGEMEPLLNLIFESDLQNTIFKKNLKMFELIIKSDLQNTIFKKNL